MSFRFTPVPCYTLLYSSREQYPYVHCHKGLRLHGAVSDKVRDELCFIVERCGIRLIAERPKSHRQMLSFRQREGAFLLKTPDLVLPCFDASRSFTIVDIKVIDPAAASYDASI